MNVTICLTGFARSGKDSVAQILTESYGYTRIAFADEVRGDLLKLNPWIGCDRLSEIVNDLGWDEAKKHPEVRRLLQVYGTEVCREGFGGDCWINRAKAKMEPGKSYVFTDVRFDNEYQQVGGILVNVQRPGITPVNDHASETSVTMKPHFIIKNDGSLSELAVAVSVMMEMQEIQDHSASWSRLV